MNNKILPFIIAFIVVIIVAIGFFTFLGKKSDTTKKDVEKTSGPTKTIDKGSILESKDGGANFASSFSLDATSKIGNADVLSIAFHTQRAGEVVVGSVNDGLFRRVKDSIVWQSIVFPPKNIYSFILDKNDPDKRMFASGVMDKNGRIYRSIDGGEGWRAVYTEPGDGTIITSLSQHHSNTNIIFAGTSAGTVIKSVDGGESWKNIGNKISGTVKDINYDADKLQIAYLLTYGSKIYYTPDGGVRWLDWEAEKAKEVDALKSRATQLSRAGRKAEAEAVKEQAQALADKNASNKMPEDPLFIVADPSTSGTLYASADGGLYRSTDFGKYWNEVNIIESAKSYPIRSIAINPNDSKEIIFIAGKSFYKSKNYGDTWSVTPLSSQRDASFVAYDPFNTDRILIGVSGVQLTTKNSRTNR